MSAEVPTRPTRSPAYFQVLEQVCNELKGYGLAIEPHQLDWAMDQVRVRLMARQGGRSAVTGRIA